MFETPKLYWKQKETSRINWSNLKDTFKRYKFPSSGTKEVFKVTYLIVHLSRSKKLRQAGVTLKRTQFRVPNIKIALK